MKKQQLSSVIEFDKDLNDVKEPNETVSKICQNDMVDELIADWYDNQFNEFNVFMADYLNYLVWYVYKKKKCKKMSKEEFLCYLNGLSQNSVAYRLYQSFINETIYKKGMEQQLFLLIDEINPLKINREKSQKANDKKYQESRIFEEYIKDFYARVKLANKNMTVKKFCKKYKEEIVKKLEQDCPTMANDLKNHKFYLEERCKNIIYNRKK